MINKQYQLIPSNSQSLNKRSTPIPKNTINTKSITNVLNAMLDIASGLEGSKKKRTIVGLAAPQIGLNKRIVIVDVNSDGTNKITKPKYLTLINPRILYKSKKKVEGREGCFSTGRVCGIVERSKTITISALGAAGDDKTYRFKDFTARIVQHEMDHLNGIRFPDRITNDYKLHWVENDEFTHYRDNWQTWTKKCPRSKWQAVISE